MSESEIPTTSDAGPNPAGLDSSGLDSSGPDSSGLSHFDATGRAHMVDVSQKSPTRRQATASAFIELSPAVLAALPQNPKGNPLEVARFAGIQAAKQTSSLIPMCHPLPLSHVDITADITASGVRILATVATTGPTGVEMEALTAASIAALTIYDMTKALTNRSSSAPSSSSPSPAARAATTSARNSEPFQYFVRIMQRKPICKPSHLR